MPIKQVVSLVDSQPRHKTDAELLTDSKQMVSKLKANIAKDISFLAIEQKDSQPKDRQPQMPAAPKSPRMRLPTTIPEPKAALE